MSNQRGRTGVRRTGVRRTGVRRNFPPPRPFGYMSAAATRRGASEGNTPSPSPPPNTGPASPNPFEGVNLNALNFETEAATPAPQRPKAPAVKRKASDYSPEQNIKSIKSKKSKTIHNPKTQGFSKKNRRTQNKKKGNKGNNSKKGKKKKKKSKRK